MKLLVGLGNPGSEFEKTRHNAGFMVIDAVAEHLKIQTKWQERTKFWSQVAQTENLLLAKPQTFMNDSGKAVQALLHFYKIANQDLWVIHDDLDLELGKFKIQRGTGPKVHNGLASIYQALGTKDFWHVRVGVDSRQGDRTLPGHVYVLQALKGEEWQIFKHHEAQIVTDILSTIGAEA